MILAAGLSPAWQQIVVLDALAVGEVNRAREFYSCASGKVLNVGLALHHLCNPLTHTPQRPTTSPKAGESTHVSPPLRKGGPGGVPWEGDCKLQNDEGHATRTLSVVGGATGEAIRCEFEELGVAARWIETQAPTRVCTTILDRGAGTTTELVENARPISEAELAQFREAYCGESRESDVVVLTGSFPAGVPATLYRDLLARTPGRVVLDAQGAPLIAALEQKPFLVKPNREELANTLRRRLDSDVDLCAAMRELCRRGAQWVVITQGKERVWVASASELLSLTPPRITVVNPIGSGDCLAAGIAFGLARGDAVPDAVRFGMAAAADNASQLLPARLNPARVQALTEAIRLS